MKTFFHEFYRENEQKVLVEFTKTPEVPATYWHPAEGGEVEIVKVCAGEDGWNAKWTDAEDEEWSGWLAENFDVVEAHELGNPDL
ncbi:hypothetical protein [Thalassospira marina]|uniref:Uncharacterized protein n=1 Tax=Thalassospira marina TaxID=2048283 RepID=A0A2N3KY66_9PROT|nr:hypothetical protein [Thalassospira marina]PKR55437.1 hypothetical protein COO20_04505 [Thalassospira marina]